MYFLCMTYRLAPLPLKVDGFSMGAVMGYCEQHTLLLLTTDEEISSFLNVSKRAVVQHADNAQTWQSVTDCFSSDV